MVNYGPQMAKVGLDIWASKTQLFRCSYLGCKRWCPL